MSTRNRHIYRITLAFLTCWMSLHAFGQTGIRGLVTNQKKEPLPFASISVRGTSVGTIANEEGRYELHLKPGYYEIVFQYLGYQAGMKTITITDQMETFDAVLAEQILQLNEVKVGKSKEDPAYAIMRRAIAKSRYHALQVDRYKARAYTKSSIVITDLPLEFLYKKELEKVASEENFKKGVPILNETVSEIEFRQPNIYRQRVIAARNSQDNNLANPNEYLLTSFYKPDVVQTVSPLSPKAFSYYKFEYLGTFRENGVDVSKIKVVPRAYGDGVFKGVIHIIEDLWAIHSLDLETVKMGIGLKIKQIYAPVQNVWLPIQQQFNAEGGLYGFKAKGEYVISQTFQELQINPNFPPDIVVLDPKQDKEEIKALPLTKKEIQNKEINELLSSGKKLSAKELRKVVKHFEKQQLEEKIEKGGDVDLFEKRITSTEIDSLATQRNTTFWDSLRTVPLTRSEVESYQRLDSLLVQKGIEKPENISQPDTTLKPIRKNSSTIDWEGILWGRSFRLNKNRTARLTYTSPFRGIQVNTVEGLVSDGMGLGIQFNNKPKAPTSKRYTLNLQGSVRYSLERNKISPRGVAQFKKGRNSYTIHGGRMTAQYNAENPIPFWLNTFTTLLFEQNFAKIYQKDILRFNFNHVQPQDHYNFSAYLEYADRVGLGNAEKMHRYRWIDWRKREFTSNTPELIDTDSGNDRLMPRHQAFVIAINSSYKPFQKYKITKGKKTYYRDDSPEFKLTYRKGIKSVAGSDADFDFLSLGLKHGFETGIRSKLYYQLHLGAFLNANKVQFPDFHHFPGNQFFFQFGDPVGIFRLLDYYRYSTDKHFLEGHVLAEFRQLLLTQLEWFRKYGIKETFQVHFLSVPRPKVAQDSKPISGQYTELGYGFDVGIRFPFRIEIIGSFEGKQYYQTGIRIGTTMNIPFQ